jgi:hypothetical protein
MAATSRGPLFLKVSKEDNSSKETNPFQIILSFISFTVFYIPFGLAALERKSIET